MEERPLINLTIDNQPVSVAPGTTLWEAARIAGIERPGAVPQPEPGPGGRLPRLRRAGGGLAASFRRRASAPPKTAWSSRRTTRWCGARGGWWSSCCWRTTLARARSTASSATASWSCSASSWAWRSPGFAGRDGSSGVQAFGCSGRQRQRRPVFARLDPEHLNTRTPEHLNTRLTLRDTSSPVIAVDHAACILCDRCIRACDLVQVNDVIGRGGKGYGAHIVLRRRPADGRVDAASRAGSAWPRCPTGALTDKPLVMPFDPPAMKQVRLGLPVLRRGVQHHVSRAGRRRWCA